MTSIGEYAFEECTGLKTVYFGVGSKLESISDRAFYNCKSLSSITIPDDVKEISNYAFYNCKGLTSVTLPNSVEWLGYSAFYNCSGLTRMGFNGYKAQWNAITKGYNWNYNTGAYTVYCTDGTLSKS